MVIRHDTELPPAICHGEETEVVVLELLFWVHAETKLIEQVVSQQQLVGRVLTEHGFACSVYPLVQLFSVPGQHELEELGD